MIRARQVAPPRPSQGDPTTTLPVWRPHCMDPCQILSVLNVSDDQWVDFRGRRLGVWLRSRGIGHGWAPNGDVDWLAQEARVRGARVIISEAQVISVASAQQLAEVLPDVTIVHLLHGAPAWCASYAPTQTYGAIRQSRDLPNVYVGTVSDPTAMAWTPAAKVLHLPNPISLPPELADTTPSRPTSKEPLCVSLIARDFAAKNWGGMLAAIGILASRRPVRVILAGRNTLLQPAHFDYLASLGIPADRMEFGDWSLTLHRVAKNVHVGLACSFTDSLNLIASEHCLLGIPVVGSPSTDWMPPHWRVNPQDPGAMADLIEHHARYHRREGESGRKIVRKMAAQNENLLLRNLRELLD